MVLKKTSSVGYKRVSASCLTIAIIICIITSEAVLGQVLIIKVKFSREACAM
jgi:hypothetical protein